MKDGRILSRSTTRKLVVMLLACAGFVLLYETTAFDSREEAGANSFDPAQPVAGQQLLFEATAYCKGTTTASGATVRTGIAASDPSLLPVGSVVNITTDDPKYNGVYTIMDTGPKVQGRILDVYMWSCHEALKFGRKQVQVQVLRLGWNPTNSSPSLVDRLFRRREAARQTRIANDALPAPGVAASGETATAEIAPTAGSADEIVPAALSATDSPAIPPVVDKPSAPAEPVTAPVEAAATEPAALD